VGAAVAASAVTAIDRSNPLPLWAQLLGILRQRVAAGEYVDGFPTDLQLSTEFGLSRHTVRDAVRRLHDEGLLDRRRGIGTFVRPATIEQPSGALYSLFRTIEAQGREQRSDVLDLSTVTDPPVAARLGLASDTALVRLERLRRVDGAPLAHDTAWLPADLACPLLEVDFSHTALYDELARTCGCQPDAGSEWVHPVLPDQADRRLLELHGRQAAYRIERLGLAGDRAIEWRESVVRGDTYTFVAHWSPTDRYAPALAPTPVGIGGAGR
jgi:GntR family transcriptional regulator